MRTIVVYPLPFDQWSTFETFFRRFISTWKTYPPGVSDYELWLMCNWGEPTDEIRRQVRDIKARFIPYMDHGCDIGSAQYAAHQFNDLGNRNPLIVSMTSRCFFHREGWLRRYVEAREQHGPGLYGASVSNEGGKLHVCTRAYAMDAKLWINYPETIDTREKGQRFEVGEWCLTEWACKQTPNVAQVTWDGVRGLADARNPIETAIFRRGKQQAMLVHDKHTKLFDEADEAERERLAKLADGK